MVESAKGKALVIKRKELELEKAKIRIRMDYTPTFKLHKIKQINSKLYWVGEEQTELRNKMKQKGLKSHDGINWYRGTDIYRIPKFQEQITSEDFKSQSIGKHRDIKYGFKSDKVPYTLQNYRLRNKLCLQCGRNLPKYKSKFCSDKHRLTFYKENPRHLKERERQPW